MRKKMNPVRSSPKNGKPQPYELRSAGLHKKKIIELLETKWTKLAPTEFSNVYFCEEKTRKELLYVSLILSWNWRFITRTAGRQNRPTYAVSWSRIYPSLLSPQNSTRLKHGLSCTGDELLKTDNSCQVYIGPIAWMRTERHAQSRHLNHALWEM